MCQGVILSYAFFTPGGQNKERRVRMTGVGSHSFMFRENARKLSRAGWTTTMGEDVVSYESNLTEGWGRFTKEAGTRDGEPNMYAVETYFRKVAGNGRSLIRHVRKHGVWHDSLLAYVREGQTLERLKARIHKLWEQYAAFKMSYRDYGEQSIEAWAEVFRKRKNRIPQLQRRMGARQYDRTGKMLLSALGRRGLGEL